MSFNGKFNSRFGAFLHDLRGGKYSDTKWLRLFVYLLQLVRLISKYFIERRIHVRSAALTYYTAFALIPILAFVMGIAKGFGFDSYVRDVLIYRFPSHVEMTDMVLDMVQKYLDHAKGDAFVGIGIVMLLWSVYRMFNQIERAFNDIWGIEAKRPLIYRIPNYIAIVFFVPLLILFTSAISFYFKYAIQYFGESYFVSPSLELMLKILPFVVSWLVFTLLYWFVPNTQVSFKFAALSGLLLSACFMVFKHLYVYFQSWMTSYNVVYGTLAAVPFLLMFLQITWMLVLLGCSLTFSSQCIRRLDHEEDVRKMSHKYFEFASLVVTKICVERMLSHEPYVTLSELTDVMPYRMAKVCSEKLCRAGVLDKVELSYGVFGYRSKPELSELTLSSFYIALDGEGTPIDNFKLHENPKYAYLWKFVDETRKNISLQNTLLIKDLEDEFEEKTK